MPTVDQSYTTEGILTSLGYPDPMTAARQQARMILLGRRSRYRAEIRKLEHKWGCTLEEMRQRYTDRGSEDFDADDDYVQWQWYADAIKTIDAQLAVLAES
jgi:hypothetical protein